MHFDVECKHVHCTLYRTQCMFPISILLAYAIHKIESKFCLDASPMARCAQFMCRKKTTTEKKKKPSNVQIRVLESDRRLSSSL